MRTLSQFQIFIHSLSSSCFQQLMDEISIPKHAHDAGAVAIDGKQAELWTAKQGKPRDAIMCAISLSSVRIIVCVCVVYCLFFSKYTNRNSKGPGCSSELLRGFQCQLDPIQSTRRGEDTIPFPTEQSTCENVKIKLFCARLDLTPTPSMQTSMPLTIRSFRDRLM